MAGKVIQPPKIVKLTGKTIFLAGPIQGAADWQQKAINIIQRLSSSVNIANPRRQYLDGEFVYEKQVDWETNYLRKAGDGGVVLFWLAKEHNHSCERAFAQTSRFELAEWKIKHESDGIKLAVGIEPGFTNERYIRRRFSQDCSDVHIQKTLEATCKEAVRLVAI